MKNAVISLRYGIGLLALLIYFVFGCKYQTKVNSSVNEAGGISLDDFPFELTKNQEEIKLSVLKMCLIPQIHKCSSASVVSSEKGYLLAASHQLGVKKTRYAGTEHGKIGRAFDNFQVLVSGHNEYNGFSVEPEQFRFDVVKYVYEEGYGDIALIKVVDEDLENFKKWTYPLKIDIEHPQVDERIYMVGYPQPYYSDNELGRIKSDLRSNREILNFNGDMVVTTGVFGGKSQGGPMVYSGSYTEYDSAFREANGRDNLDVTSINGFIGSSGSPLIKKDGSIFAVASEIVSDRSKVQGNLENLPNIMLIASPLKFWTNTFEYEQLSDKNLSMSKTRSDKLVEANKLLQVKALRAEEEIRRKLKIMGNRIVNISTSRKDHTGFGEDKVICLAYNKERPIVKVYEVEIEVVNEHDSTVRYKLPYLGKENKFLWFSWGEDLSWSPKFKIPTSFVLTNARVDFNYWEYRQEIQSGGITKVFLQKNFRPEFTAKFLNETITGVSNVPEKWQLERCDTSMDIFQHRKNRDKPIPDWAVEERNTWLKYEKSL